MTPKTLQVGIAVVLAVIICVVFFIFNPFTTTVEKSSTPSTGSVNLVVQDETVGTGAVATAGSVVTVNYTGKLENGTVFDTSVGKTPFKFTLGVGQVIPGWDQGVAGMKVGGKRVLIIPPAMAYGAQGVGPIPPNATLTFEVELLDVAPAATPAQ